MCLNEKELKEEYKRLFDDIHASPDLYDRIMKKETSHSAFKPMLCGLSAVAAALVIFAAVHDYDFSPNTDGIISETAVQTDTSGQSEDTSATEQHEIGDDKFVPSHVPATDNANEQTAKKTSKPPHSAKSASHTEDARSSQTSERIAPPDTPKTETVQPPVSSPAAISDQDNISADTTAVQEKSVSQKRTVRRKELFSVNPMSTKPTADPQSAAAVYSAGAKNAPVMEEWDNNRYFDYIGTDILNDVVYSEDLEYIGESTRYFEIGSNGVPVDDTASFDFIGNDERFVQITTTKDLTYCTSVISDTNVALSNINGTEAAVFADNNDYSAFMIHGDTSYLLNTTAITEEEICNMLTSIAAENSDDDMRNNSD